MPPTLHLDATHPADVLRAAELLRAGATVAFATETVYGLGANALSAAAVAKVFSAKQRPSWDPLIVHVASLAAVAAIAAIPAALEARVHRLAAAFWPGPLTLLLPRAAAVPDAVTAGRALVGVRIPSHPAALALLRAAALPIAAPSANRFGHTSPTTAAHVLADLEGRIDAVLDAGPTPIGLESSVLDPTQTPMRLYRLGAATAQQIETATGVAVEIFTPTHYPERELAHDPARNLPPPESLPSPGVGLRHYAPRAHLVLVESPATDPAHSLLPESSLAQNAGHTLGLMLPNGWATLPGSLFYAWGAWSDLDQLARNLFAGLRALDDLSVDVILCPVPSGSGLAAAIRDRLEKAARPA